MMNKTQTRKLAMMSKGALPQPGANGSKHIRVLIADPDESLQATYRETLAFEGFEVTAAFTGLECAAQLRVNVPDVIVLEPRLPWGGADGVLAMIGEVPVLSRVPVMVLTSSRDPQVLSGVSRFPISDYHLKPLSPDRLAVRLRALFDHPRMHFTLAEQTGRLECSISRRTVGRVHDLHVENIGGRVIVRGRSDSHHVRQLGLVKVQEAFEASKTQSGTIEMEIEVSETTNQKE
jgi:DNA-binding response OmpR family regulator